MNKKQYVYIYTVYIYIFIYMYWDCPSPEVRELTIPGDVVVEHGVVTVRGDVGQVEAGVGSEIGRASCRERV